jgi:hypothetical protein
MMPDHLKDFNVSTYGLVREHMPGTKVMVEPTPEGLLKVSVYDRGVWSEAFTTENPRVVVDWL